MAVVTENKCNFATKIQQNLTMHRFRAFLLIVFALSVLMADAQSWMVVHRHAVDAPWALPVAVDSVESGTLSADGTRLLITQRDGFVVPVAKDEVDSLTFDDLAEGELKDKYQVFQLFVFTQDGREITSRDEYLPCYVGLNGAGSYGCRWAHAGIRGRGNSTFLWYDKKPYRIKLDRKQKMLGMDRAKSWVLLANYRDVTDMMNTYVYELGRMMGLPYTNHSRYVELFVNNNYRGLYQLTEQVQQGENRVAVSDERGILLTLDVDDGPAEAAEATNNFWTKGYSMPAAVKYPDDELLTDARRDSIRGVFGQLEAAIKDRDYEKASALLDMESMARYLIIQELVYNVELSAPRSIFLHKDGDGPWRMGPLWDFDAGYDFDWTNMYSGHTFFTNYRETVMGTDPVRRNGNYPYVPQFFTDLFATREFVELYKRTWTQYADSIVTRPWAEVERYVGGLRQGAIQREELKWRIRGKSFDTEVQKLHVWLENRARFMDELVRNIPVPQDVKPIDDEAVCGTVNQHVTMNYWNGYHQDVQVKVNRARVLELLGVADDSFDESLMTIVPLMADGSEGQNRTNGTFGGWFDANGNPGAYAQGHVYIEVFDDLFNWDCGLYQDNCYDEEHTVVMQYQYPVDGKRLKVNVRVHFTITSGWW